MRSSRVPLKEEFNSSKFQEPRGLLMPCCAVPLTDIRVVEAACEDQGLWNWGCSCLTAEGLTCLFSLARWPVSEPQHVTSPPFNPNQYTYPHPSSRCTSRSSDSREHPLLVLPPCPSWRACSPPSQHSSLQPFPPHLHDPNETTALQPHAHLYLILLIPFTVCISVQIFKRSTWACWVVESVCSAALSITLSQGGCLPSPFPVHVHLKFCPSLLMRLDIPLAKISLPWLEKWIPFLPTHRDLQRRCHGHKTQNPVANTSASQ